MIRAIALDDEPLSLEIIELYSKQCPDLRMEGLFTRQTEALRHLHNFPVDLIFLDISMPVKNGLEFYKQLEHPPHLIFTTAHPEFAVEGFNVNAVDYLLKPFTLERFQLAVEKASREILSRHQDGREDSILIRADYKLHRILIKDILYVEGLDDYIQIHLRSQPKVVARLTLKNLLERLPAKRFIRIHKSFIISLNNLEKIHSKNVEVAGKLLPIGDSYRSALDQMIHEEKA